jgi:coenzyme F420-dependent glucose-6-phosphate dehydrogenase
VAGAMATISSYHVSHEQFSPRELLELVQQAEEAGFDAAFSSDHFHPWSPVQGHSGFLWSWLGAALQRTRRLSFSGITVPGGWRYHPTLVAQAIATLGEMFPGRLPWMALGSGEAINEHVVGAGWPEKADRDARLEESAGVIRRLLHGERVTSQGRLSVIDAKVWSRPVRATQLVGAAMSEATAHGVARWAEGLLTTSRSLEDLRRFVTAYRNAGGSGDLHLKVDLSWAPSEEEALRNAHEQWRFLQPGREAAENLRTPEDFENASRNVTPEQMREVVLISADPDAHVEWLRERAALGFRTLDLHNVGRNQREFIEVFARRVLPALRADRSDTSDSPALRA